MSNKFYAFSPWVLLFSGTISFIFSVFGDQLFMSLRLFALVFVLAIPFQLLTLAALPFAVVRVSRAILSMLRHIDFARAATSIDGQALAQNSQQVGGVIATCLLRLLGAIKRALRAVWRAISTRSQRVDWSSLAGKFGWALANLIVTALPVIVILATVLAFSTLLPRHSQSPGLLWLGLTIALPFMVIASVALKTKFDMARIFTYSLSFLKSMRKKIMFSGPIIAVVSIGIAIQVTDLDDTGWWILLAPIMAGQIILIALAIGLAILPLEMLAKRLHIKRTKVI